MQLPLFFATNIIRDLPVPYLRGTAYLFSASNLTVFVESRGFLMKTRYIHKLRRSKAGRHVGNKARSLSFLAGHGFAVPLTYVCTGDAYRRFQTAPAHVRNGVLEELRGIIMPGKAYAVRSSSSLEDGAQHSHAGLFETQLNIRGPEAVMRSIEAVWGSTRSERVRSYINKRASERSGLYMAVIIQEMVVAECSGVVFTQNPVTGCSETVVEAVQGSGTALVQDGATPSRWIIRKDRWEVTPEQTGISPAVIEHVAQQAHAIARHYRKPADLEWAYNGHTLYWLQLRDITGLQKADVYTNVFSREFLPGIIKPLVWSINIPVVNGGWKRFLTELVGPNDLDVQRLAKMFYYRAYFNTGAVGTVFKKLGFPSETIHTLLAVQPDGPRTISYTPGLGAVALLPRLMAFVLRKLRFGSKIERFLISARLEFSGFDTVRLGQKNERQLIGDIEKLCLLTSESAYFNVVTQLMLLCYSYILKRCLCRYGYELEGLTLTGGGRDLEEFDPIVHLTRLHDQFRRLDAATRSAIRTGSFEQFLQMDGIDAFREQVTAFMEHFGHLSDSGNDFTSVPWRENPSVIIGMIAGYESRGGMSPAAVTLEELDLPLVSRAAVRLILARARRFRVYKEAVSFLHTYGYGLFRNYFLALGDLLVRRGCLRTREDIFYLYFDEVRDIVLQGTTDSGYAEKLDRRKEEMRACENVRVPDTIYGDHPPPLRKAEGTRLKGIAASRGFYRGSVKVVRGINDFSKMRRGDILVIPYSDVGLTPLFAKAGAVVAESGGLLSHSSIIAREYRIPAVISVNGACLLGDDTAVTVNGYQGEVIVHSD